MDGEVGAKRWRPRSSCSVVAAAFLLAGSTMGCSATAPAGSKPVPVATSCSDRIDAVVNGLIDAGYRITSRYDPNERRPGAISAKSLTAGMADLSLVLTCEPELHYRIAGAGVLGLAGGGRTRANEAIQARLSGKVPAFAEGTTPPSDVVARTQPGRELDFLIKAGVTAFEVEIHNRTRQPLLVHPGAVTLLTTEGTVLGSVDPAQIANRLAIESDRLDPETLRFISRRQLRPVRLKPGEFTRGVVYFARSSGGRVLVRALTDRLEEVLLYGSVRPGHPTEHGQ
ncbi:MAG: hypothetical protein ACE5I7_08140 [Candidatus Binatia bacterium]